MRRITKKDIEKIIFRLMPTFVYHFIGFLYGMTKKKISYSQ